MGAPDTIKQLVDNFSAQLSAYKSGRYNEAQLRVEYVDPLFESLGWDIRNRTGYAEAYKDVIHEYSLKTHDGTKAPDYCFRIGGVSKFFLETKKPSVDIKSDVAPAFQIRRYAWSAKLSLSILTDFEELAVYDCRIRPQPKDKASVGRLFYFTFDEYLDKWHDIAGLFAKEAIQRGALDEFIASDKRKKGTSTVDNALVSDMENWRDGLARNIALRNAKLSLRQLNHLVQATIDRIIFLRICEDRDIEAYGKLQNLLDGENIYQKLTEFFKHADAKYNSGLFHFAEEKGRGQPDKLSLQLNIDDKPLREMIRALYYPVSPYVFSKIPADILGQVYEQFLGKEIRLTASHQAKVEYKPEVRKAGGVYYTPTYIVDYIVKNTVGELLKNKTPAQAKKLRVLDPACGSGSFLLGAYQYLLRWYRDAYAGDAAKYKKLLYKDKADEWQLSTQEKKDILLSNIYGVDIDRQAVEVTKLSLLLKVLEGENKDTLENQMRLFQARALPDLSNNIKCGNSLIGTDFFHGQNLDMFGRDEMEKINAFDWESDAGFGEIMRAGGFDAVIGNPPYVRQETLGEEFKSYVREKYATYSGTADLYVYFIEKSCALLNKGGYYSVIVANKWMRGNYGRALREFLKNKKRIHELIDFGDLPVFQGATTYPCIIKISNGAAKNFKALQVKELVNSNSSDWISSLLKKSAHLVNLNYLSSEGWALNTEAEARLLEKLKTKGAPLEEYVNGKIYYGIKTGLNEAFVIDTETKERLIKADPKSAAIIKPFLEGKDIKRYGVLRNRKWLIFLPNGYTQQHTANKAEFWFAKHLPAIYKHLRQYEAKCKKRWDKGEYWWELRPCDYYKEFEKPKMIYPEILKKPEFTVDFKNFYTNKTCFIISLDDKHLLAVLNSKLVFWLFKMILPKLRGGFFMPSFVFLGKFPISKKRNEQIPALVDQMLAAQKQLHRSKNDSDRRHYEQKAGILDKQIDALVYDLYELTEEEIKIVEGRG